MNVLVEQHGQHHLRGFLWQVGQEQNLIGWLFRDGSWGDTCGGRGSNSYRSKVTPSVKHI